MGDLLASAGKRFLRVGIAAGAGYGSCYALNDLSTNPEMLILAPFIAAAISAIGKFIRSKFGIILPF